MKQHCLSLLFVALNLGLWASCVPVSAFASTEGPPTDCTAYPVAPLRDTCENARKFGLSFSVTQEIEYLAAREYAFTFCGAQPDTVFRQQVADRLAQDTRLRALYDEHLTMLKHRCIYDPDGWCQSMGFQRR